MDDGSKLDAKVDRHRPKTDLALLKVKAAPRLPVREVRQDQRRASATG